MDRRDFLATGLTVAAGWPLLRTAVARPATLPLNRMQPRLLAIGDELDWVKTGGPSGGLGYNVRYIPGDEQTLFVTDAWSGLYKSENGGQLWLQRSDGITAREGATGDNIPVFAFNTDPNDPGILWAGCQNDGGLYRSIDQGVTWARRDSGLDFSHDPEQPRLTIRDITIAPGDSDKIYVTGELHTHQWGDEFERVGGFLYRSDDAGASFSLVREFDSLTRFLLIHPENPDEMVLPTGIFDREADVDDPGGEYASGPGIGIYRSTDGGATWSLANNGLDPAKSMFFGGAARSPHDPDRIIVTAGNNNDGNKGHYGAVYLSTDGGESWTDVTPEFGIPVTEAFTAVAFSPSDPDRVYCGSAEAMYRSTDGGATWSRFTGANGAPYGPDGVPSGFPIDMNVSESDPDKVYVNNYGGGVFLSRDGAETWENFSDGYTGAEIHSLSVHPSDARRIAAVGRSGTFLSLNGGREWRGVSRGVASYAEGQGVSLDPSDETGQTMLGADAHAGLITRTTDGGESWSEQLRLTDEEVGNRHGAKSIVFAPSNPAIVYAGFVGVGVMTNPHNTGLSEGLGVYRSSDGGVTWQERNSGLPAGAGMRQVTGIAVSHQNPDRLYITLMRGGVWFSENGGSSWTSVMGNLPAGEDWTTNWTPEDPINRESLLSVAVQPEDDQVVMIGTNLFGAYRSEDGGQNWQTLLDPDWITPHGTSDHAHIMSLALDPVDSTVLYAADWHGGVWRGSVDATTSDDWEQINGGLSNRAVETITVSADGQYLYAATQGEGVFRKTLRLDVAPPGGLELQTAEDGLVTLSWQTENNPDVTAYTIWRGTAPTAMTELEEVSPGEGSILDQVTESAIYYYTIKASGSNDTESDPAALVSLVHLDEPVGGTWSLISLPAATGRTLNGQLAYDFTSSYNEITELVPGKGVWVKQEEPGTLTMRGVGSMSRTLELTVGWNLIGGPAIDVPVTSLRGDDSPMSDAPVYGYDKESGAYQEVTQLRPARGYWMHASTAGTLELAATSDPVLSAVSQRTRSEWTGATLSIRTAEEIRELSLLREGVTRAEMDRYRVPPRAPGNRLDVRAPGGYGALLTEDELLINSVNWPVELRLHAPEEEQSEPISVEIRTESGESLGRLMPGSSLRINEEHARLRISTSHTTLETAFHSVYPNPFRSETTLSFEVAQPTDVQFDVYDLLGRRVARLPEADWPAGHHTMTLEADGWASGIYLIRMTAGDVEQVHKVTHIR